MNDNEKIKKAIGTLRSIWYDLQVIREESTDRAAVNLAAESMGWIEKTLKELGDNRPLSF